MSATMDGNTHLGADLARAGQGSSRVITLLADRAAYAGAREFALLRFLMKALRPLGTKEK